MKVVERVRAGAFLIASPILRDPNFVQTVVLMCEHGPGGSWGLVVNRMTALTFGELLEDLPFPAAGSGPVFWGGPCETSRMQVLHRLRRGLPEPLEICSGVHLGLEPETFRTVAAQSRLPGEALHAYVGHAGWGAGQLDAEMETGSWIVCTANPALVFETPPDRIWSRTLESLGADHARLTRYPPDPRLN